VTAGAQPVGDPAPAPAAMPDAVDEHECKRLSLWWHGFSPPNIT
jgi:hypothetical protein